MTNKDILLSIIVVFISLYIFICFEDMINRKEFIDSSISTKGRIIRSFLYVIIQNQYGFGL